MCTGSEYVTPAAQASLAVLLAEIRATLASQAGVCPESVVIGPVDFGTVNSSASCDNRQVE